MRAEKEANVESPDTRTPLRHSDGITHHSPSPQLRARQGRGAAAAGGQGGDSREETCTESSGSRRLGGERASQPPDGEHASRLSPAPVPEAPQGCLRRGQQRFRIGAGTVRGPWVLPMSAPTGALCPSEEEARAAAAAVAMSTGLVPAAVQGEQQPLTDINYSFWFLHNSCHKVSSRAGRTAMPVNAPEGCGVWNYDAFAKKTYL